MRQTPLQTLLSDRLGRPLWDALDEGRAAGTSWRDLAEQITAATGQPISWETLRAWNSDRSTSADSAA